MLMSLSAGLRVGARITLINIQEVYLWGRDTTFALRSTKFCENDPSSADSSDQNDHNSEDKSRDLVGFIAHCRSTILIIETASESETRNMKLEDGMNDRVASEEGSSSWNDLREKSYIKNMKQDIHEYVWRLTVYRWYKESRMHDILTSRNKTTTFERILFLLTNASVHLKSTHDESCCKSKPNKIIPNPGRTSHRDPYIEFFDHGSNDLKMNLYSYFRSSCNKPAIIELQKIHNCCMKYMKKKLESIRISIGKQKAWRNQQNTIIDNRFKVSWTGSDHLTGSTLFSTLFNCSVSCLTSFPDEVFTAGILETKWNPHTNQNQIHAIQDTKTRLPIILYSSTNDVNDHSSSGLERSQDSCNHSTGDLSLVSLNSVVVSFFCLGDIRTQSNTNQHYLSGFKLLSPASISKEQNDAKSKILPKGTCTLLTVGETLFIASVHLLCSNALESFSTVLNVMNSSDLDLPDHSRKPHVYDISKKSPCETFSLRSCLEREKFSAKKSSTGAKHFTVGRFLHHHFRNSKVINEMFMGLIVSICHIPINGQVTREFKYKTRPIEMVQCIDIRLPVLISDINKTEMKAALGEILCINNRDTRVYKNEYIINLACAWWQTVEGLNNCNSLVLGGLKDQRGCPKFTYFIVVKIPLSSIETDTTGHKQWTCDLNDSYMHCLREPFITHNSNNTDSFHQTNDDLDMESFMNILPRIPHRLPGPSKTSSSNIIGKRSHNLSSYWSGVPKVTIQDLQMKLCQDLCNESNSNLAPSLVRRIVGSRLICIGYCRARAQCTKCLKFLVKRKMDKKTNKPSLSLRRLESVQYSDRNRQEISYWHQPLPLPRTLYSTSTSCVPTGSEIHNSYSRHKNKKIKIEISNEEKSSKENPILCCPNGCPTEFAAIRWECSGVLNGDGQAKLYADGEAALLLLGKELNIDEIEKGAWNIEGGVIFNRSIPLKSPISSVISESLSMNLKSSTENINSVEIMGRKRPRKLMKAFEFLSIEEKAEYLLYKHCKESKEPVRPLQFLCRCKPIITNCLRQSEVEVIEKVEVRIKHGTSFREITTPSLPILALSLVDICDKESFSQKGWDLLRSL